MNAEDTVRNFFTSIACHACSPDVDLIAQIVDVLYAASVLGITAFFAQEAHASVSAITCADVQISIVPATPSSANGVGVLDPYASRCAVTRLYLYSAPGISHVIPVYALVATPFPPSTASLAAVVAYLLDS